MPLLGYHGLVVAMPNVISYRLVKLFLRCVARLPRDTPLAVAVGAAAAAHGIDLDSALIAYLQAFAANLVSAGVRLIPLGQTDGQLAVAALEGVIVAAARAAPAADLDTFGTAAPGADWCSMRHETQYTRLFRS